MSRRNGLEFLGSDANRNMTGAARRASFSIRAAPHCDTAIRMCICWNPPTVAMLTISVGRKAASEAIIKPVAKSRWRRGAAPP
jgi:hypothetical protein